MSSLYQPFDWYQTPLYYDIIFDEGTQADGAFLQAVHERYVTSGGRRMLEPACGSGRLVAEMVQRGFDVSGFDISAPMLRFAHQRLDKLGLKAELKEASMDAFAFKGKFDMAHCLVSTFKYLLDEAAAQAHLHCVAEALKRGGVYVLGLHLSEYDVTSCSRERWVAQRDGTKVVCNIQSWPAQRRTRTEKVRSRLVVTEGGRTSRYESNWNFRTYDLDQLRRLIRSATALEHVATYDFTHDIDAPQAFDGQQLDNVLILRKR
jgi:SAM-dependent methyltransferase